ncbi:MAG TPA: hypothetical protein PKC21_01290 [Oligoflexia bacterium]|nr:hypothetical protein [Oligoflexia bacterium]HMR23964.1 hypothetical protein [Oligoflexia bacterium]
MTKKVLKFSAFILLLSTIVVKAQINDDDVHTLRITKSQIINAHIDFDNDKSAIFSTVDMHFLIGEWQLVYGVDRSSIIFPNPNGEGFSRSRGSLSVTVYANKRWINIMEYSDILSIKEYAGNWDSEHICYDYSPLIQEKDSSFIMAKRSYRDCNLEENLGYVKFDASEQKTYKYRYFLISDEEYIIQKVDENRSLIYHRPFAS